MTRLKELEKLITKYKEKIDKEDYEEIIETIGMLEVIEEAPLLKKLYAKLSEISELPVNFVNIKLDPLGTTVIEIKLNAIEAKNSNLADIKVILVRPPILKGTIKEWQTTIQYNHKLIKEHQEKLINSVENIKQYLTEVA